MIESINQAGGAGGGVQSVSAGTGITVDNTDPENPIVSSAGIDTDEKAKVSANDTTAGYLNGKLVAGSGITFTENNNGSNETLTVALGNHDASLITTGTIATARLGSGTASSATYLAGDQTYKNAVTSVNGSTGAVTVAAASHTHAASDITSGTIATARLGSGTASSTTALFGDQTYKSVVTSVNGGSGAVSVTTGSIGAANVSHTHAASDITSGTIATARLASGTANSTTFLRGDQTWATISAGDTTYTVTTQNAENTTNEVTLWSFTVPANSWNLYEIIWVPHYVLAYNNSGSGILLYRKLRIQGADTYNYGSTFNTGTSVIESYTTLMLRRGNSNSITAGTMQNLGLTGNMHGSSYHDNVTMNGINNNTAVRSPIDFTQNITISMVVQFGTANFNTWLYPRGVRAYKPAGQV